MKRKLAVCALTLMIIGLCLPGASLAQDDGKPLSWVGLVKTKSGKSSDVIAMSMQNDKPMYDKLVAEGKIESWGMAIPINHRAGDAWNHLTWATTKNWAAIGDLQKGFQSMFAEMDPEKMKEMSAKFAEATYEGSHADWILRHQVFNAEDGATSRYFLFSYWTAKPGQGAALEKLYNEIVPKAYGGPLASGRISGYGLMTPELHGESFTHLGWAAMPGLDGIDALNEAIANTASPEQFKKLGEITVPGTHRDQVLLIVHNSRNAPE